MAKTALMKNPVLQNKLGQVVSYPSGNVLEEVAQQDMNAVGGLFGLSEFLGNKGRFCTLTVECMPSCNAVAPEQPID
jgi:hypothetical protein